MILTRQQRRALKAVFDRGQNSPNKGESVSGSYRDFRRRVHNGFCGEIMVPWCGMWLGIEPDGYTHS